MLMLITVALARVDNAVDGAIECIYFSKDSLDPTNACQTHWRMRYDAGMHTQYSHHSIKAVAIRSAFCCGCCFSCFLSAIAANELSIAMRFYNPMCAVTVTHIMMTAGTCTHNSEHNCIIFEPIGSTAARITNAC